MRVLLVIARRCLACRAQRGPLGVLPKAKRPRGVRQVSYKFRQFVRLLVVPEFNVRLLLDTSLDNLSDFLLSQSSV